MGAPVPGRNRKNLYGFDPSGEVADPGSNHLAETATPFFFQNALPFQNRILELSHEMGIPILFGRRPLTATAQSKLFQQRFLDLSGEENPGPV